MRDIRDPTNIRTTVDAARRRPYPIGGASREYYRDFSRIVDISRSHLTIDIGDGRNTQITESYDAITGLSRTRDSRPLRTVNRLDSRHRTSSVRRRDGSPNVSSSNIQISATYQGRYRHVRDDYSDDTDILFIIKCALTRRHDNYVYNV